MKMGEEVSMVGVLQKIGKDKMFLISAGVAALSMFVSRPRLADVDWKTIISLASLLALIAVYEHIEVLSYGASLLVKLADNKRFLVQIIVCTSFLAAMILTNDAAIIALTPILIIVAQRIKLPIILPVVLVNVAANLGSMVTPFGNPQNLYLLNRFGLNFNDFIRMALPISIASLLLLWLFTLKVPHERITNVKLPKFKLDWSKLVLALIATFVILAGIFSFLSMPVMLATAVTIVVLVDPKIFGKIDYALLLTFLMFFIAVGDVGRAPIVHNFMNMLGSTSFGTYLSGLAVSQVISNVPAVIILAPYTKYVYPLFLGVNIGGLGTLIASLANLLAYKQYYERAESPSGAYFKIFLQINILFLLILGVVGFLLVFFQ
ncbi:SLC13 family permease [Ligilactobacillus acidipiscis]|uniref:SLC13 family permease n=2 Tax=Ligilactobacillus acidipiscis TaxID=89059 RepID=UPI0022DF3EC4|nr:SLC13 family permease [Ligilactobacillus acidipiscis]